MVIVKDESDIGDEVSILKISQKDMIEEIFELENGGEKSDEQLKVAKALKEKAPLKTDGEVFK